MSSSLRLSLALGFVLFAMCAYFLQPDSGDVSSSQPTPAPFSPAMLTASADTASDSTFESSAPSEQGQLAKSSHSAAIVFPASSATGTHANSITLPSVEIQHAATRIQSSTDPTPREILPTPGAATTSPALIHAVNLSAPFASLPPQVASSKQGTADTLRLAKLPAVFVEPDPAAPLTEAQAETVKILQKEFIEAIGGSGQDPADPEYFQRWRTASSESDQRFKTLFGAQAFLERERFTNLAGTTTQ